MKLVRNWRRAHRWITMRLSATALALATGWTQIPEAWRNAVPKSVLVLLFALYALGIMGGRVIRQKSP